MRSGLGSLRRVLPAVVTDYALSHFGYFVVMPVLPMMLAVTLQSSSASWIGLCLGALSLAMRGGSLFVSGWMHRTTARTSVAVGLVLVATGFGVTAYVNEPLLALAALTLAGLGMSINGIAMRGYIALRVEDRAAQNTAFSVIQVVVNVAAAIGPLIANLLLDSSWFRVTLIGSAALFLLAAVLVPLSVERDTHLAEGAMRPPLRLLLIRELITDSRLRRIAGVVLIGGFLYGQFFSSFAIMINEVTDEPLFRAGFYTLNAIVVVALQFLVTGLVNRAQNSGVTSVQVLVIGVLLFGSVFAVLAIGETGVAIAYIAIVLFSIGETVYTPMVNTAFVEASEGRPVVEAFNLRQIASASGEGLGSVAGGWLYVVAASRDCEPLYWGSLSFLALMTLPMSFRHRRAREGNLQ